MKSDSIPLRVLVVDDEPPIRRFLRTSLTAQGYDIVEAEDGSKALEEVRRRSPDLLVLDLGLPGIDGLEVIRRLRGSGVTLPIVVLSSRVDEAGKVEALDLGADDYVTKPFGVEQLLARILTERRQSWPGRGKYKEPSAPNSSALGQLPKGWKWASPEQ